MDYANILELSIFYWTCVHHTVAVIANILAIIILFVFWKKIGKIQDVRLPFFMTFITCSVNLISLILGEDHLFGKSFFKEISIKGCAEFYAQTVHKLVFGLPLTTYSEIQNISFKKIKLGPKCYPNGTQCKIVVIGHLLYFGLVLTPYCKIHFKKSGNLKKPQILSN